jgi:uncharacterized hydrophobic protein (TIGR00271 family)
MAGGIAQLWNTHVVGDVDHDQVLARVHEESGWTGRYAFLIVISAGISILGLLLPSSAVLIGAMLISPLMMPIIGLGFGIATFDWTEIRRAASALAIGSVAAVALSAAFVAISPLQTVTTEIALRTKPNLYDLLVAFLSAIAGVYALVRGRGDTVVGVAIAIALMPPLAVVGFGIATLNQTVFTGALLLFLTNLVTIALTAALGARLYRFGAHLSPAQTRLQGLLIVAGLLAFAVPLAIALRQIAWESVANRQIRDAVLAPFPEGARIGQLDIDFERRPITVRGVVLTPRTIADADPAALGRARTTLGVPFDLHIDQVRVGGAAGAGEAAQIAAAQASTPSVAGTGSALAARIGLVAGVGRDAVLVDAERRHVLARAGPLPGATLATYRTLEERLAASERNWRVSLIPPALPFGVIRSADGVADPDDVATIAWAAQRRDAAVEVSGAGSDPLMEALAKAGVTATQGSERGALRVAWTQ